VQTARPMQGLSLRLRWLKPLDQGLTSRRGRPDPLRLMRVLSRGRIRRRRESLAIPKSRSSRPGDSRRSGQNFFSIQLPSMASIPQGRPIAAIPAICCNYSLRREGESMHFFWAPTDLPSLAEGQHLQGSGFQSGGDYMTTPAAFVGLSLQCLCAKNRKWRWRSRRRCWMPRCSHVANPDKARRIVPSLRAQDASLHGSLHSWVRVSHRTITIPSAAVL